MAEPMKRISLGKSKYFALVDDFSYPLISKFKWRLCKFKKTSYAVRNIKYGGSEYKIYMHRQILGTPIGLQTDHKNGNGLDNRMENIRICLAVENKRNSSMRKSSGFKGVYDSRKYGSRMKTSPWIAQIKHNGKKIYLGYFKKEKEAAAAYNTAAKKLFGKFARLNAV